MVSWFSDVLFYLQLWLSLASLCVLDQDHVERLSSGQWVRGGGASSEKSQPRVGNGGVIKSVFHLMPVYMYFNGLTHWGRDKMAAISQMAFLMHFHRPRQNGCHFADGISKAFSWMKVCEFRLKFHWSLVLTDSINKIPALAQIVAWGRTGNKPLSELMMVRLQTRIYASLCLNELTLQVLSPYIHVYIYTWPKFGHHCAGRSMA